MHSDLYLIISFVNCKINPRPVLFCRFVWFCDPRANAVSLLAERRIRGRLLGRLRLELQLSGSKRAIAAQRKDALDVSEGVTCFVC